MTRHPGRVRTMTVRAHGETIMRKRWVVLCVSVGLAAMTQVQAHDMRIEGDHCGYDSVYDVQVKSGGVDFSRSDARPTDVFMHDGQLSVDGRAVAVSADDAARLRDYEAGMRELLPKMAGIAQEAVGIGFDSLAIVAATLAAAGIIAMRWWTGSTNNVAMRCVSSART
ncbi:DUF2884 family protein [Rhodanobacter sp. T12-5]|nr:DUF2884 family protein [Rhodanobacter sp. T12-5]